MSLHFGRMPPKREQKNKVPHLPNEPGAKRRRKNLPPHDKQDFKKAKQYHNASLGCLLANVNSHMLIKRSFIFSEHANEGANQHF